MGDIKDWINFNVILIGVDALDDEFRGLLFGARFGRMPSNTGSGHGNLGAAEHGGDCVRSFVEQVDEINRVYNTPMILMFDRDALI